MKYAKAKAREKASRLHDTRALELSAIGVEGFFWDHAKHSLICMCDPAVDGRPDPECDRGQALHRLSASARAGKLDAHTKEGA